MELPSLYLAADEASLDGQRRYLRLRRAQLLCLVLAALVGALTIRNGNVDVAGVGVGLLFLGALGVEYLLRGEELIAAWYDGRAAAESVKDVAWRYAMKAEPFLSSPDPDAALIARLNETLDQLGNTALSAGGPQQITDWMRATRRTSLDERRATYVRDRVEDQWGWYHGKAQSSRTMAGRWRAVVSALAIIGVIVGGLKAFAATEVDMLGIVATMVSAAMAWLQTRQYETLAVAYGIAAEELAGVRSMAESPGDDAAWSLFVNDAEGAISREHTLWRASRTVRGRGRRRAGSG